MKILVLSGRGCRSPTLAINLTFDDLERERPTLKKAGAPARIGRYLPEPQFWGSARLAAAFAGRRIWVLTVRHAQRAGGCLRLACESAAGLLVTLQLELADQSIQIVGQGCKVLERLNRLLGAGHVFTS